MVWVAAIAVGGALVLFLYWKSSVKKSDDDLRVVEHDNIKDAAQHISEEKVEEHFKPDLQPLKPRGKYSIAV